MKRIWSSSPSYSTPIALVALVLVLGLLTSMGSEVVVRTATSGLILLLATVAMYIFVGNSGIMTFGHAGFMMIGGYAASLFAYPADKKALLLPDLPGFLASTTLTPEAAVIIGGLVAGFVAALFSVPLARLSGMSASLVTFAFLGICYEVVSNWSAVTGGPAGIAGIPVTTGIATVLPWVVVAILIAGFIQLSAWGRRLRASREDEVVARSIGIGVKTERRMAFTISGALLGVAGGLYALYLGTLTPSTIYLDVTFITLAMLIIGGIRSLSGAVLGSIFITVMGELLRRFEGGVDFGLFEFAGRSGIREVGLALVMLAVLLLRPEGFTRGREIRGPSGLSRLFRRQEGEASDFGQ